MKKAQISSSLPSKKLSPIKASAEYRRLPTKAEKVEYLLKQDGVKPSDPVKERIVSHSSVYRHIASIKAGRDPHHIKRPGLFNKEEEEIEDCAIAQISSSNKITVSDIIRFAENVMILKNKDRTPSLECFKISTKWARRFIEKSNLLKLIKTKYIDLRRLQCSTIENMRSWFSLLKKMIDENQISSDLIINMDETGVLMTQPEKIIVVSKETQCTLLPESQRRKNATLFFTIFADGTSLDPIMLWPSHTLSEDLKELKYRRINCLANGTGWMSRNDFKKIMMEMFLPKINEKRIELHGSSAHASIILDDHTSRLCFPVMSWCRKHLIHLLILPSHTTHLTQPLDRFAFAHFKNCLKRSFQIPSDSSISSYRKALIPAVSDAVIYSLCPKIVRKLFAACVIHPFNPSAVYQCLPQNTEASSMVEKSSNDSSHANSISMKLITGDDFFENFTIQLEKKKKSLQTNSSLKHNISKCCENEPSNINDKSFCISENAESFKTQKHEKKTIERDDIMCKLPETENEHVKPSENSSKNAQFIGEKRKRKYTRESAWGSIFDFGS